jgi:hypothetical protein
MEAPVWRDAIDGAHEVGGTCLWRQYMECHFNSVSRSMGKEDHGRVFGTYT